MKPETYANKLLDLFPDLKEKVDVSKYSDKPVHKRKSSFAAIPEDQIQNNREGTALFYFLQAPELFTSRRCKRCDEPFLVSRHQVAYCSYTCIEHTLKDLGIKWNRKGDMELLVKEVYEGNEPLWIRKLDQLKVVIDNAIELPRVTEPADETETKDSVGV